MRTITKVRREGVAVVREKERREGCYLYSSKSTCPVSLACSVASYAPTNPLLQFEHRSLNLRVFVNWLLSRPHSATRLATRAMTSVSPASNRVVSCDSTADEGVGVCA